MSNLQNDNFWFYWFQVGQSQGMNDDQAADFADAKFNEYL